MERSARIYVAGHTGLVGAAIVAQLQAMGYDNLLMRRSSELDLRRQQDVADFFRSEQPDYVFLAAARVGGIHANNIYRADFLLDNLQIQNNVLHAAWQNGVRKLLFLGSSCIYPKLAPQPLKESYLLAGKLEPTNEPYAIAKIAGIKLCEALRDQYGFNAIACMPTNLYGPNDNFHLETSHALPAMLRKFHEAKLKGAAGVTLWGSGTPRREFLHVSDAAEGMVYMMQHYNGRGFLNLGSGRDISIRELALLIADITGFGGEVYWDKSKPDGTPRKLMDVSQLAAIGWQPSRSLRQGIADTYRWFCEHYDVITEREAAHGAAVS